MVLRRRHENKYDQLRVTASTPDTSVIFNYSNIVLTDLQQRTLRLGFKFCITLTSVNLLKVKTEFEKLYCILSHNSDNHSSSYLSNHAFYKAHNFFTRKRFRFLEPSTNKDIIIVKPVWA